jgi:hypothetical protein
MWELKRLWCRHRAQVRGVASSLASQRSNNWRRLWGSKMKSRGSETKYRGRNMKPWDSVMITTPRPSPSNSLSFRLVNYFIRYRAHINIFKTNCIATCIANGAATRNLVATVTTSPTTTSFQAASTSSSMFYIIRLSVSSVSYCSLIGATYSYTRLRSLAVERARRHTQR